MPPKKSSSQAAQQRTRKEYTSWTFKDDEELINALYSHLDERTGDNGSFKDGTWNAVAAQVDAICDKGGKKSAQVCKTRLNSVRFFNYTKNGNSPYFR